MNKRVGYSYKFKRNAFSGGFISACSDVIYFNIPLLYNLILYNNGKILSTAVGNASHH